MSELFRKVLTKDRLPDKKWLYHTSLGDAYFQTDHKCFVREDRAFMPISWMEPINIPTPTPSVQSIYGNGFTATYCL